MRGPPRPNWPQPNSRGSATSRKRRYTKAELKLHTLRVLEFDKVRERLAERTSFTLSREMALALSPSSSHGEVARLLRESGDAMRLLEARPQVGIERATDVRHLVQTAALGGQLSGADLVQIADTMGAIRSIAAAMLRNADLAPSLAAIARGLADFRDIESALRGALSLQGEVLDAASEALGRIRREEREAGERLQARLKDFAASAEGRRVLQEPFITTRSDRFVLAVKAEHRGQMQGLVHDVSSSGATVFMEPLEIVEMGNRWRELKLAERREVQRVLLELSALAGTRNAAAQESVERLGELDLALAKARYGRTLGAAAPELAATGRRTMLSLVNARHPLLGTNVVPISLALDDTTRAMVISGPNTGGKTVALKTIGLLAAMVQAGMPIPAEAHSRVTVFDAIYADIGDEQSIEQSLSTFSSHMTTIVEVLEDATGQSLVLLDELGAGTDPQEGSAVATAVLTDLVRRDAATVVTTHHGALKTFAHGTSGVQNASVEFDPKTLAPTYRLTLGLPGRSNALAIAQQLGLPERILADAKAAMGTQAAEVDTLLADIQRQREMAEEERAEAEQERRKLEEERVALQTQAQAFAEERRQSTLAERLDVQVQAEEMKSRLRQASRRLNALAGDKGRVEIAAVTKDVQAVRTRLEEGPWKVAASPKARERLQPGDVVRVEGLSPTAEVLQPPDKREMVEVQAGGMRLRLHRDRIQGKEKRPAASKSGHVSVVREGPSRAAVTDELWVHGMRAQEAAAEVEDYIEQAALAGHQRVRIVHGKGKGVLRTVIQQALKKHSLVSSYHEGMPEEGGEGVTIAQL